jgi:hypothetical protein
VLVYALSTGHKVGLAVVGACFILFALASSFLFPRFRPNYPGRGLPAFIIVAVVFFFAMLTAVEGGGAGRADRGSGDNDGGLHPADLDGRDDHRGDDDRSGRDDEREAADDSGDREGVQDHALPGGVARGPGDVPDQEHGCGAA